MAPAGYRGRWRRRSRVRERTHRTRRRNVTAGLASATLSAPASRTVNTATP